MDSSSESTLTNDWDIISCEIEDNKNDTEEHSDDVLTKKEMTNVAEKVKDPVGTGVHDIPEHDCCNHNESSSSSEFDVIDETAEESPSNVPISNMEFSLSRSLGRSPVEPEAKAGPELVLEQSVGFRIPILDRFHLFSQTVQRIIIVISMLVVIFGIYISASDSAQGVINRMRDRMSTLQAENIELKHQIRSKFDDGKMLIAVENQLRALKDENFKLSSSMQALVLQLEEQTAILKKEKERKVQDPYRNEIERLQKHIGKLHSDNVMLHNHLYTIKYNSIGPLFALPLHLMKEDVKLKEFVEQNKNDEKNTSEEKAEIAGNELGEILTGEITKIKEWREAITLRGLEINRDNDGSHSKDESEYFENKNGQPKIEKMGIVKEENKKELFEEEMKLNGQLKIEEMGIVKEENKKENFEEEMKLSDKDWKAFKQGRISKERAQQLSARERNSKKDKRLYEREQEFSEKEQKHSRRNRKPNGREQEFSKKKNKPQRKEKERRGTIKEYELSWKRLKKNIRGTIDNLPKINVPDMLSNYVDKQKVENVFESVGLYFKKAQEKTKKMLNYNNEGKDHFWNFLGDLRKKWSDLKDDFFQNNYGHSEDNKPQFSTDIPSQPQESSMASKKSEKLKVLEIHDGEIPDREGNIKKPKYQDEDLDVMTESNEDAVINWFLKRNKHDEDLDSMTESDKDTVINWFLKRNKKYEIATMTEPDKVAVINWFLKRNKNDEDDDMIEVDKDAVINWFLKRNRDERVEAELQEWMTYWNKFKVASEE
ncbi:uncharacterized protein TNCT_706831 [Trichonephila clavata]|uniref:Uncharacterized protein n=1 Tax=Trichonephila clavata TaxID=2740835 RepID=A0A8X6FEH9_TRICU|nr:uncharacterized protein TNCT_706831 [Trichonephila clavata]